MDDRFRCPGCADDEEVTGKREGEDIRLTCGRCGASWIRDTTPRCATCGGTNVMFRPRTLTRFSRGTQLSVLGWQNVPLCRACDDEALTRSTGSNGPLAADYVPAAMHKRDPAAGAPGH